jgi:DNA modification methylase
VIHLGDYRKVLLGVTADLIFTSPPYNIGGPQPRRDGQRRRGLFDARSFGGITGYADDMPEADYQESQAAFLIWAADHLNPGGTLVYNHKPRQRNRTLIDPHQWLLRADVRARLHEATYPVIWNRRGTHNHGRGQIWQQTERLYVLRRAEDLDWRMDNYRRRGLDVRYQSDLWSIPVTTHSGNAHCAPFPEELAEAVISMWSHPGDLVCDPYAGSGTTAAAALSLGRRFAGAEIVGAYHELATGRLMAAESEAS